MGLAPEVMLIVKHTFLEFVETAADKKGKRGRAFTDTALLKSTDDDLDSSDQSAVTSVADVSGPRVDELAEDSACWPATPMLEPLDKSAALWWGGKELVDLEATMDVKAVLGMTAADMQAHAQSMAWWWLPSDLALSLDTIDDRMDVYAMAVQQASMAPSTPAVSSRSSPPGCFGDAAPHLYTGSPAATTDSNSTDDTRTTVMIRNLPDSCGRDMLQEVLDSKGFSGQYDFLYVPVDFGSGNGLGYAFVNLLSPEVAANVWSTFDGFQEWSVPSETACTVCWSHPHQGLAAHVERYMNSPVMHHSVPDAWKPALFMNCMRVAFPPPTKTIKAPKAPRCRRTTEAA